MTLQFQVNSGTEGLARPAHSQRQDRLDRIAIRQTVSEVMLATTVGLTLRIVGDDLRRQLMAELRENIRVSGFTDPERADTLALEMEERTDQLLDQIERLATIETPTPPAPRG